MSKLKVSADVPSLTVIADEVTPQSGKRVLITKFFADAAFSQAAVVKLVWKYDHATEPQDVVWTCKGSSEMPFRHQIDDADGIRKLAVVCDNGLNEQVSLSGYCEYVED